MGISQTDKPLFLEAISYLSFLLFIMFEKSLTDLIRGIRANKKNEQKYIAVCLQEIRNEVKSNDLDIKSTAVAKLTYVSLLHSYQDEWLKR